MSEIETKAKNVETKPNKLDAQSRPVVIEQTHHLEALKIMLEIQKIWLEIENQQLVLQKKRLESVKERITIALEISDMIAEKLHPHSDVQAKARLARSLLLKLLQIESKTDIPKPTKIDNNGQNCYTSPSTNPTNRTLSELL